MVVNAQSPLLAAQLGTYHFCYFPFLVFNGQLVFSLLVWYATTLSNSQPLGRSFSLDVGDVLIAVTLRSTTLPPSPKHAINLKHWCRCNFTCMHSWNHASWNHASPSMKIHACIAEFSYTCTCWLYMYLLVIHVHVWLNSWRHCCLEICPSSMHTNRVSSRKKIQGGKIRGMCKTH